MTEPEKAVSHCCGTGAHREPPPEPAPQDDPEEANGSTPQDKVLKRLARIEGQVKGIQRMVDEHRYCIDIVNQISAAQAALGGVIDVVLRNHLETCVTNAMTGDDPDDRRAKIEELIKLYARARTR